MGVELVFIAAFICLTAMVFGIRYMSNKEKMAMIERGIEPGIKRPSISAPTPFLSLKFGLLMIGLGLGLIIALFAVKGANLENREAPAIYFGFLGLFGGIGLVVSYLIEKKWLDQQK